MLKLILPLKLKKLNLEAKTVLTSFDSSNSGQVWTGQGDGQPVKLKPAFLNNILSNILLIIITTVVVVVISNVNKTASTSSSPGH